MATLDVAVRRFFRWLRRQAGAFTDDPQISDLTARIAELEHQLRETPQESVAVALASQVVDRGNALKAGGWSSRAERDYSRAFRLLQGVPKTGEFGDPLAFPGRLNKLGMLQRDAGKLADSIATLDRALDALRQAESGERHKTDLLRSVILNNRGITRVRLEDREGATADFTASIESAHKSWESTQDNAVTSAVIEAISNRGTCYSHSGKHDEALADYDAAIAWCGVLAEHDPEAGRVSLARCLENRAWVFRNLGNPREAERDFTEAGRVMERRSD